MSELTVKALQAMFPNMQEQEIARLLGTSNYTENTTVSSARVAAYKGLYEQPLCVFYAKNNTDKFIPLLSADKQKSIMSAAGIDPKSVSGMKNIDGGEQEMKPHGLLENLKILNFESPKSPLTDGINTGFGSAFGGDATLV
ncbi:hypothetical protein IKP85_03595 [bacterium]|nr:hypothetical protein [bacterium]